MDVWPDLASQFPILELRQRETRFSPAPLFLLTLFFSMSVVVSRSLPGAWPNRSGIVLDESWDDSLSGVMITNLAVPPNSAVTLGEETNESNFHSSPELFALLEVRHYMYTSKNAFKRH